MVFGAGILWPYAEPLKITCVVLAVFVLLGTLLSQRFKCRLGMGCYGASFLAALLFFPTLIIISNYMNEGLFGVFTYERVDDIPPGRDYELVTQLLPPQARDITLDKQLTRSLARYHLSEADLLAFIDKIWAEFGEYSSIPRDDFVDDGQPVPWDVVRFHFQGTGWPPLDNAVIYHGPTNSQYGGPIYYLDRSTDTVYQATFYW